MPRCLVLVAALLLGMPPRVQAQLGEGPPCLDSATTQRALTACAGRALEAEIQRERRLIAELRDSLDAPARALLDSSEASWTAYQAVQCRLETRAAEQGSAGPMELSRCRRRLVEARIRELAPLLCAPSPDGSRACPAAEPSVSRPARRGRRR